MEGLKYKQVKTNLGWPLSCTASILFLGGSAEITTEITVNSQNFDSNFLP